MPGVEPTLSKSILVAIVLAPLIGSIVAGLFGRRIGRAGAHWVTILGVAASCQSTLIDIRQLVGEGTPPFNQNLYTWFDIGGLQAHVGFMVDKLTAMMMVVVTFVSLLVHIYTIGYMEEDPGYHRFFSYISLFTDFLLPFEVAAVILTVAVVAAVMLTLRHRGGVRQQDPSWQSRVRAADRVRLVRMEPVRPAATGDTTGGEA